MVLVVGCAQGVRRGISLWVLLPAAYLVDIWLTLQLEVIRPFWLWMLNVLVLSVTFQLARGVAVMDAVHDVPDDPPLVAPTAAQREMAAGLRAEGFVPVADTAVLVGEPAIHLWVLVRADGTLAELVHTEPRAPGFGFRTQLDPAAPGYDTIESVPWKRGWPAPTSRRIALPKAPWPQVLAAHDAALADAVALGAQPVPVRVEDALANVLESDRAAARRVLTRPWRSMARMYGVGRRPRGATG